MKITLTVNGRETGLDVEPSAILADVLREQCRQTSVHLGCEHGVCGACNVIVDDQVVRACLTLAGSVDGCSVTTLEGLCDATADRLRRAFGEHHALQCGFCTPGMVVSGYDIVRRGQLRDEPAIRQCLSGNICRCTGYHGIVAAVVEVANEERPITEVQA
ncbi:(2Fe-2S)-binding protein [Pigmentiphaga sp. GD03639]|jgi:carbon-monoxide dehydrogenase small subunit|uniref:2Fe-2S ferredoxin-type domain-containing protein n=1 Tax=Pigmentiphaga daeguensis TaxID=414049 RepID=A0ABP3LUE9_9BURK|nr:(2Fe-2S)-binding protein [Pigmentiphaga sp. GD03639]MDH2237940.1 (2Fe-2S)-binding protein [Pigmentiphaga sp. GD03639]